MEEQGSARGEDATVELSLCRRDCCVAGGQCLVNDTFYIHQHFVSNSSTDASSSTTRNTTMATTTTTAAAMDHYSQQHDDTAVQDHRQKNNYCQTPMDVSKSLEFGAWKRHLDGSEEWVSSSPTTSCSMPPLTMAPPSMMGRNTEAAATTTIGRAVLFVGDSTVQEIALMVARGAGASRGSNIMEDSTSNSAATAAVDSLNCTCTAATTPGTTKDCRIFDSTAISPSSSSLNVSMIWSGHAQCEGNRMGVTVVDNADWKSKVISKVESMQPNIIFFQVPMSHSCTDIDSCSDAIERYISFLTQLPQRAARPSSLSLTAKQQQRRPQVVLLITGSPLSRSICQGSTGRHCPAHLRKWMTKIRNSMSRLAPDVAILDIFSPTEKWLDLRSGTNGDPFRPACPGMERHLTCDFTRIDFWNIAWKSPFYILPPGRLAATAVSQVISTITQ